MKAYTDLEQSRRLAEILPRESADMWWSRCTITDFGDGALKVSYAVEPCNISQFRNTKEDILCWSLAALLNYLKSKNKFPEINELSDGRFKLITYIWDGKDCIQVSIGDSIIDACVDMIEELHKLKML